MDDWFIKEAWICDACGHVIIPEDLHQTEFGQPIHGACAALQKMARILNGEE